MKELTLTYLSNGQAFESDLIIHIPYFGPNNTAQISLECDSFSYTPVTGVLTAASSPYYFYESIFVPDGEQLIIEPGVTIRMDSLCVLKIEGNIQALGTEENEIMFYNLGGYDWGGLIFENADSVNNLNYCTFYHAEGSIVSSYCGGAIFAYNSDVKMNGGKVWASSSKNGGGVYLENCPTVEFSGVTFLQCDADSSGGAGYFKDCESVYFKSCMIKYCEAELLSAGLHFENCDVIIDSSWIDDNYFYTSGNTRCVYFDINGGG